MGEPAEWQRLHREVKRWDEQVHDAQVAARRVRSQIATFDQEGHQLRGDQREREAKVNWVLALRNVATAEEQSWIKAARPVLGCWCGRIRRPPSQCFGSRRWSIGLEWEGRHERQFSTAAFRLRHLRGVTRSSSAVALPTPWLVFCYLQSERRQ